MKGQARRPRSLATGLERLKPGDHVAVALSGGVDSFLAARLLLERGLEVSVWHLVLRPGLGPSPLAEEAAGHLGLRLEVLDLSESFERLIIEPFVRAYLQGLTPSPCVACNPAIKFGLLLEAARRTGAGYLATGHYAGLVPGPRGPLLARPHDSGKDQTYFLARLSPAVLERAVFPLAGYDKDLVKKLAGSFGLPARPESQEICFLAGSDYRDFIRRRLGDRAFTPGDFVDLEGRVRGRHRGLVNYTVGQRRGLNLAGPEPYYVLALDPDGNRVVIGSRKQAFRRRFPVGDTVFGLDNLEEEFEALVQIRSRHRPAPAWVRIQPGSRAEVSFHQPQRAVAPGQAAAFYRGQTLIGGGWIERSGPEEDGPGFTTGRG
ncbi:MAG: tRNA 2-thiouridine(34) synthase MnmA [Thermodesulfobacteriota bacterium]